MKMRDALSGIKASRFRKYGIPIILFAAVLTLYLTMITDYMFVDEQDVYYGGYNVVMSGDLYKVYPTQHMPFSYYISAVFALLGVRTHYQFRLCFYLLMSALWTILYVRHRKHIPDLVLLAIPFFYLFQLKQFFRATSMISDHWQGFGYVVLILELILYCKTWRITLSAAIFISLAIVLSFGTTFVSAYFVFIIFLGVLILQAGRLKKHPEEKKTAVREDLRLVAVCLCPFLILIGWYAVSGNLGNFIGGAYELNTTIYSKYIEGFGADAGGAFLGTFPAWIRYLIRAAGYLPTEPVRALVAMLQTAALLGFCIAVFRKNAVAGVTVLLASIMAGIRDFDEFHGTPYIAVCSLAMAYCLGMSLILFVRKRTVLRGIAAALSLACAVLVVTPYVQDIWILKKVPEYLAFTEKDPEDQKLFEVLTEPGETIVTGDISETSHLVMRGGLRLAECVPATSNPWFYEYYGSRELEALKQNKTRIVALDPDGEIWSRKVRNYAADFIAYLEENYYRIGRDIYVRREDAKETAKRLDEAGYGAVGTVTKGENNHELRGPMFQGETQGQYFRAAGSEMTAVYIKTATYLGSNRSGLTIRLLELGTREELASCYVEPKRLKDNEFRRVPLQAQLEAGRIYLLTFTSDDLEDEEEETLLQIYTTETGSATEDEYAVIYGEPTEYNLSLQVEYRLDDRLQIIGGTDKI